MDKVYIVFTGEYSGRGIKSVHTDKIIADRIAVEVHGDVEEWSVNVAGPMLAPGLSYWYASMQSDGDNAYACVDGGDDEAESDLGHIHLKDGYISGIIAARDKKHAIKIMNERRTRVMAMLIVLPPGRYEWPKVLGQTPDELEDNDG